MHAICFWGFCLQDFFESFSELHPCVFARSLLQVSCNSSFHLYPANCVKLYEADIKVHSHASLALA